MKDMMQMSKRRRVFYCIETNNTRGFTFCVKYLTFLLRALMQSTTSMKLSSRNNEEQILDIRKRVRFEIDMAMVASVGTHFRWTKKLKQKLVACQWRVPMMTDVMEIMPEQHQIFHRVPFSVNYLRVEIEGTEKQRSNLRRSEMEAGEREEVRQSIELLREVVPVGDEACSLKELMGEVMSYVTCLQFQVAALRSLLSSSSSSDSEVSDTGTGTGTDTGTDTTDTDTKYKYM
jgi:hypothetical protein